MSEGPSRVVMTVGAFVGCFGVTTTRSSTDGEV
jgi:hypothetical protein